MLPKVATHLGRAFAAAQSQTTHAVRNVLQLQSSSTPGGWNGASSSSGWGSYGTGSGGAKYHAGSRFQSGYSGPGRAVTQAEQAANDAADDDDIRGRRRSLGRRKSLSFIQHESPAEKLNVLRAIKLHARHLHAISAAPHEDTAPPPPPSSHTQAITDENDTEHENKTSKTAAYNETLWALHVSRKPDETLDSVLETYNEMLARSVLPNFRTYMILISAFTHRDFDVQRQLRNLDQTAASSQALLAQAHKSASEEAERLRAEKNFGSAFQLFQACCALPRGHLPLRVYNLLLRSCALHQNVDVAIYVFSHLERREDIVPSSETFKHLLTVYTGSGDLAGAREVFDAYREACSSGRVEWTRDTADEQRKAHLLIYSTIVEAFIRAGQPLSGITLLEQMLDSKAGYAFGPQDIPNPAPVTFSRIIRAFCDSGDMHDALSWFERLLQQPSSAGHPLETSTTPTRPSQETWNQMLPALANAGMMPEFNRLYAQYKELAAQDGLAVRQVDRTYYMCGTIQYLRAHPELDDATAITMLDAMVDDIFYGENELGPLSPIQSLPNDPAGFAWGAVVDLYLSRGQTEKALVSHERMSAIQFNRTQAGEPDALASRMASFRHYMDQSTQLFLSKNATSPITLKQLLRLSENCQSMGAPFQTLFPHYMEKFTDERTRGPLSELSYNDWTVLLNTCLIHCRQDKDNIRAPIESIIEKMQVYCPRRLATLSIAKTSDLVRALASRSGLEAVQSFIATYKPQWHELVPQLLDGTYPREGRQPSISAATITDTRNAVTPTTEPFFINTTHSKFIEQFLGNHPQITPLVACDRVEMGLRKNLYPTPATLALLIGVLGRLGEMERIRWLYGLAQEVLGALERHKMWQSRSWFQVEDHMALALAHAGDLDGAHIHRMRILEQGGAPSADTYGALIHHVQDTTDDATNAMALFQESQARGVAPNIYLYNTIISKLAKARKADHALALFSDMKSRHLFPTSVTYGALIAACCRVGDAASAETLFDEMVTQKNFKPRVPPYNTMMQLYTHTKLDRQRVLYYYNAMQVAGVKPTAHTYKLLIDAYGCIEPFDVPAMEQVFASLVAGDHPMVQGSHWAAMINAYGCVQKNLDNALALFDSISTHPSTQRINAALPDAVIFEALINVLVTLRRSDLIPSYTEKLHSYGVHMTAYIANLLIKGYAATGDIQRAREIFEGLSDPPEGVAAPHNHAPHADEIAHTMHIPVNAPVYREPSTWEAMVRAELGIGNRDGAVALLQRVQTRKFPPAVYNRISGIMLDDSVSPWPSPDPTLSPTSWGATESTSQSMPSP